MSWTQVYIAGLSRSLEPPDDEIEKLLDHRYRLAADQSVLWAGSGTTLVKRDDDGLCRGFAFLAFYSPGGASIVIDRINAAREGESLEGVSAGAVGNNDEEDESKHVTMLPLQLHAELSNPKARKERSKKKEKHISDLRLKRHRAPPIRKHPVITSSDKKRTNLGNKTK